MSASPGGLRLRLFQGSYSVTRLPGATDLPVSLLSVQGPEPGALVSVTRVGQELSVVAPQGLLSAFLARVTAAVEARVESGWRVLEVAGPLDFSLTGILASLVEPLAQAEVSVFTLSTFDTDYLLVKQSTLTQAQRVLEGAGHRIETKES